jgi:tetratricopeptide (TPR) repeat protein
LLQQQGKLDEAQQAFERGIAINEALNAPSSLAIGLHCLGILLQQQGKLEEAQQAFEREIAISEALNDQSQLAIGLHCLGGLLQQQGKLDEAQHTFEREIALTEVLNDQLSRYAWALHNLGRIWKSKREFEKAEILLKQSQEIFEDEKDLPGLAKVMNTLGGVLEKQQKWDEAEKILRQSYDLAVKLEDKRGQAIIANSLGQVIANKKEEETFEISQMYFRQSIKLGEELNDRQHLAKAHTAMGQAFLARKLFEQAVDELSKGFEIDENLSNLRGLKFVIDNLTSALTRLGKLEEALEYCDRALKVAPNEPHFRQVCDKIHLAISTRD